jgi:hypothetical protein
LQRDEPVYDEGKSAGEPAVALVLHRAQHREMCGGLWPEGAWRGEIGGKGEEEASLWAPEHISAGCIPKNKFLGGGYRFWETVFLQIQQVVYAHHPLGGSGYETPQSALCAFVGFFSAIFYPPWSLLTQSPYSGGQNVIYNEMLCAIWP